MNHIHINGASYSGYISGKEKFGYGKVSFPNGNFFVCEFENSLIINIIAVFCENRYEEEYWEILNDGKGICKYDGRLTMMFTEGKYYVGDNREMAQFGYCSILYNDNTFYSGTWENFKFQGHGKLTYHNKNWYEGNFENGMYQGLGEDFTPHCSYTGYFVAGKKNGKGKAIFSSGDTYEGEWKDDVMHGKGVYISKKDNYHYDGEFSWGKKSGLGEMKIIHSNENIDIYTGTFFDDKKDGKGKYVHHESGFVYEGNFREDKMHGEGQMTYGEDHYYVGKYAKNMKNGQGLLKAGDMPQFEGYIMDNSFQKGKVHFGHRAAKFHNHQNKYSFSIIRFYKGLFNDKGEFNERGELYFMDGDFYIGEFVNGLFEGTGKLTLKNGHTIEADFIKNQVPENGGKISYPNGNFYEGQISPFFLAEGNGSLHYTNGDVYEGKFLNGKPNGKGVLRSIAQKTKFIGTFLNGKKEGYGLLEKFEILPDETLKYIPLYDGDYHEDKEEGKGNKYYYTPDGLDLMKYSGEFKNGMKEGCGVLDFINGAKYSGSWVKDAMSGKGCYQYVNSEIISYDGNWEDNEWNGEGIVSYRNGSIFNGIFKNNLCHGQGKVTFNATSNIYESFLTTFENNSTFKCSKRDINFNSDQQKHLLDLTNYQKPSTFSFIIPDKIKSEIVRESAEIVKNFTNLNQRFDIQGETAWMYQGDLRDDGRFTVGDLTIQGKGYYGSFDDYLDPIFDRAIIYMETGDWFIGNVFRSYATEGKINYRDGDYFEGRFLEGRIHEGRLFFYHRT
jgi:hypothetical protein